MENCVFCKIVSGEIASRKVYENDEIVIFHDIEPLARIHYLCVPKEHFKTIAELNDRRAEVLGRAFVTLGRILPSLGLEGGYRIVINQGEAAGQTVPHLHLHILGGEPLKWEK